MSWDEIARREQAKRDRAARKAEREAEEIRIAKERLAEDEAIRARLAEVERQRWMTRTLRVSNKGLIDVLVHEPHKRGKNWVAIISVDPTMPGGLSRVFFDRARAKGPAKYVVPERLLAGDVLEFGADYMTSFGKKKPNRVFAKVITVTADGIEVKPYKTVEEAIDHKLVRVG